MTEQTQAQPADSGATSASVSATDRVANMLFGPEDNPPEEQQAEEAAPDTPQEQPEEPQPQGATPPEDSEEVDFEGEKFLVPKKLKDALLRQSDYTQKTQEVANLRRLADQERMTVQLESDFQRRTAPLAAQMQSIDAQLEQAKGIDWQNLDTDNLVRARYALDQLKDQKQQLMQQFGIERQKFDHEFHSNMSKTLEEGKKVLSQWIPNFTPDLAKSIATYGMGEGYSEHEMSSVLDPRMVRTLWKAKMYDELQKSTPQAVAKATKAPTVIRPGNSNVKPSASGSQTLAKIIKTSKDARVKQQAGLKWFEGKV